MTFTSTHHLRPVQGRAGFLMVPLVALACLLGMAASAQAARHDEKHTIEIGQFNRLKITDDVNVVYRCLEDSTGMASFTASPELANAFIFTVSGGQLRIQVNTDVVNIAEKTTVYVYSDYLTSVENGGNLTVTVESPHSCPEFKATQVGNGTLIVENIRATEVKGKLATGMGQVILSGSCSSANLSILGTGAIQADRLEAEKVSCNILGSGTIGCWTTVDLKVRGIGSTKIYYKGDPRIKKSGGGKLFPLTQDILEY